MSLVGSLEDLGLGDILQIVSLARKSGLLYLRSDSGDGRIVFEAGLIRAAYVKDAPETLSALLVAGGFAEPAPIDRIVAQSLENGSSRDERDAKVAEASGLSIERLQSLCREHVEQAVFEMFRWRVGEFSFGVCDSPEERFGELELPVGINAQYLMLEATRLSDEGASDAADCDDDFTLSGEQYFTPVQPAPDSDATLGGDAHQVVAVSAAFSAGATQLEPEPFAAPDLRSDADPFSAAASLSAADEPLAVDALLGSDAFARDDLVPTDALDESAALGPVSDSDGDTATDTESGASTGNDAAPDVRQAPAAASPARAAPRTSGMPLVVIDAELMALEWLKLRLAPLFTRIHIFQHSEGGVARIRQYLGRGVLPVVLVSSHVPADSLTGARGAGELVRRLRAQAPRMPILAMFDGDEEALAHGLDAADAVLVRPSLGLLADDRRRAETERMAEDLRRVLAPWSMLVETGAADPSTAPADARQRAVSEAKDLLENAESLREEVDRFQI